MAQFTLLPGSECALELGTLFLTLRVRKKIAAPLQMFLRSTLRLCSPRLWSQASANWGCRVETQSFLLMPSIKWLSSNAVRIFLFSGIPSSIPLLTRWFKDRGSHFTNPYWLQPTLPNYMPDYVTQLWDLAWLDPIGVCEIFLCWYK